MTKNDPKMANKIGDFDNNSTGFFLPVFDRQF